MGTQFGYAEDAGSSRDVVYEKDASNLKYGTSHK